MPTILIVDVSDEERALIRGLVGGNNNWKVLDVSSATQAKEMLHNELIDLVLVDLTTAGRREEQLLEYLRDEQPQIPSILLSTDTNADTATVEALGIGASSFVPKSKLARDLLLTIERLLGLTGCHRRHARLQECLTNAECRVVLEGNDLSMLPVIIGHLIDTAEDFGVTTNRNRMRIAVALEEALTNAVVHGNLEVSSKLREAEDGAFQALVRQRQEQSPFCDRVLQVTGTFRVGEARFMIRDEGPGFDVSAVVDPTDLANIEKPHGRGLLLMRAFMDAVTFNNVGNEITLVKRAPN